MNWLIQEINAKSIISRSKHPSSWFGVEYGMNIYRGCQHGCIYCDSRSECYHVEHFDEDIIVKINAVELLEQQLRKMRKRYTIGTGAMSDPYMPIEKKYQLTRKTLEVIERFQMRAHIATKSNLILRDIDILESISKRYASVAMTITTMNEDLAKIIEPHAPSPKERMEAVGILNSVGIKAGLLVMPQLPYLMEDREHLEGLVMAAKYCDAQFVYPGFGVTLRDRQREYYYNKLEEFYPVLVAKYKSRFDNNYMAACVNQKKMKEYFYQRCKEEGIFVGMPSYHKELATELNRQLSLPLDSDKT